MDKGIAHLPKIYSFKRMAGSILGIRQLFIRVRFKTGFLNGAGKKDGKKNLSAAIGGRRVLFRLHAFGCLVVAGRRGSIVAIARGGGVHQIALGLIVIFIVCLFSHLGFTSFQWLW